MPQRKRFSKEMVANCIAHQLRVLPEFTPNGWNQVAGKGDQANRDYGAWEVLQEIAEELDLWPLINERL